MSSSPTPSRWGASLLAALSAGCATPSAAPPPTGAPPPPASAASGPAQVAAPVQAQVERIKSIQAPNGDRAYEAASLHAASAHGEVFYTRVWPLVPYPDLPRCPFPTPEPDACGLLSFQPRNGAPRALTPAPHDWSRLAAGRDDVYALRRGHPYIDRIDPQGQVTPLLKDPRVLDWQHLWPVELPRRRLLLGGGDQGLTLSEVLPAASPAPGRPETLGPEVALGLTVSATAQQARHAEESGKRALYGAPRVVLLAAPDAWALVWVEATAPPRDHPAGKPWHRRSKHRCGTARPSRLLSDISVEKRLTITRFRGTEVVGEEVSLASNAIDLERQHLEARAEGDRVVASLGVGPLTE